MPFHSVATRRPLRSKSDHSTPDSRLSATDCCNDPRQGLGHAAPLCAPALGWILMWPASEPSMAGALPPPGVGGVMKRCPCAVITPGVKLRSLSVALLWDTFPMYALNAPDDAVIRPLSMVWPAMLPTVSVYVAMHQKHFSAKGGDDAVGGAPRYKMGQTKMFLIGGLIMFVFTVRF